MRTILVCMADGHAGSKYGMMAPDVELFTEDENGNQEPWYPSQTASQEYLWEFDQENIRRVQCLANGDPIKIIYDGDVTHGNKYPQSLVSTRLADQILIAVKNLRAWLDVPNVTTFRLAIGTQAHNFQEATAEVLIREQLRALYPDKDIDICFHGRAEIDGAIVDYAHHGPFPGSRDWLRGNVARFYLRDIMYQDMEDDLEPPDLVVRGHYHQYCWEVLKKKKYKSQLVILPSMCMMDDHSLQATRSAHHLTNGVVPFVITDGEISEPVETCMKTSDIRKKELL